MCVCRVGLTRPRAHTTTYGRQGIISESSGYGSLKGAPHTRTCCAHTRHYAPTRLHPAHCALRRAGHHLKVKARWPPFYIEFQSEFRVLFLPRLAAQASFVLARYLVPISEVSDLALTRHCCQYFIAIKGVLKKYIAQYCNIVGNKGGLGGGYCTIMCNNASFPCRERSFFFQKHLDPSKIRPLKKQKHLVQIPQKHLKTWRESAITGNIVHNKGGVCKQYYCAIKPRSETISCKGQ